MFKSLRSFFFPITREELPQFVPIFLMGFLICFNYYLLRCLKDTVAIASTQMGAGVLPFLKIWGVLPAAILTAFLLSRLFHHFSRAKVFYGVVTGFLLFFLLFTFFLYPNREALTFTGLSGAPLPLEILRQWPLALFYIMGELWKVVVLMVLFWGFVNTQTTVQQAARFYGPVMLGGSLAGMVAGYVACLMGESWQKGLGLQTGIIVAVGVAILLLFGWYHTSGRALPVKEEPAPTALTREATTAKGAWHSLKGVLRSRVLLCLSLIILTDYVAFSLVEILWKEEAFALYPNPADFNRYQGKVLFWVGLTGFVGSLVVSTNVLRHFGWTVGALVTPVILLVTSLLFFGCHLMEGWASLAVFWGAIHNVLARASRQAFLDPTKEMAYLPLSPELQTQGKTFVDGICPTLGKSGGALIQQGVVLSSGGLAGSMTFCALLVGATLAVAIGSVLGAKVTAFQRQPSAS
ncbi:MAG: Npt1/Npt2 family nucleotide transporter [Parachlamydiales bacterium]